MSTTMKTFSRIAAFALATALCPAAFAQAIEAPRAGATAARLERARLAPEAQKVLRDMVAAARASDPGAFKDVHALVARTPELDKKARGGKAPVALALAKMGPRAVMPLAELAALDAPASIPRDALAAARLDVVEALGILRDARVAPVLYAWLDQADASAVAVAAEAVARLDSDEAASQLLAALGRSTGERTLGILSGMGMCHRASIANALSDRLSSAPDEATARVAVKSLRRVASPWAWQTLARRDDESTVRDVASEALVAAFVRYEGETRDAAEKAMFVVDDGRVSQFVQSARARVPADKQVVLDGLAKKLATKPAQP